jgi:hypothetical protein
MTDQILDVDPLVLLDEATVVSCDWDGCELAAKWSRCCPKCAHVALACDSHKIATDDYVEEHDDDDVECRYCDHPVTLPLPWLPL